MNFSNYDPNIQQMIETCREYCEQDDRRALSMFRKLRKIAAETNDPVLAGYVEYNSANWYYDHSQYEEYQKCLERAIRVLLRSNAYELLARSYNIFAIDALDNGAPDVAYSYYSSALRFANEDTDPYVRGIILHNLAGFFFVIGDYSTARTHYRKAFRLLRQSTSNRRYHQTLMLSLICDGANSLVMEDLASAKRSLASIRRIKKQMGEEGFRQILLIEKCFEARIALFEKNEAYAMELSEVVLEQIRTGNFTIEDMDLLQEFCYALLEHGNMETIEEILAGIIPQVRASDNTYAMRLMTTFQIDYYDRIRDEKKFIEALREQNRLLLRQKEIRTKIHQYSIKLIRLVGELQEEESKVRSENAYLQIRIMTDDLTGIPNRYALDQEMEAAFERAYKTGTTLGVAIMDVDDFKAYNDRYGHRAGDACLVQVGRVLKKIAEKEKIFCARYGGDEFVVIYEGRASAEIATIGMRIEREVENCKIRVDRKTLPKRIRISQGICNDIPKIKTKPWDYLSEADTALYSVKGKKKKGGIPIWKLPEFNEDHGTKN